MKLRISKSQIIVARLLLVLFVLESCHNGVSVGPQQPQQKEKSTEKEVGRGLEVQTIQPASVALEEASKACLAEGGQLINFYQAGEDLRAKVIENVPAGFSKEVMDLPVYVAVDADIKQVVSADAIAQKRLVQVQLSKGGRSGQVYVGKRGLRGGMMEGDGEKEGSTSPKLNSIISLRTAYRGGNLKICSSNLEIITKCSIEHITSFRSYDEGILVTDFSNPEELDKLLEVLVCFDKIKRLRINYRCEDQIKLSEMIATAVQYYEDLEELDLSNCRLTDNGMQTIIQEIKSTKIRVINLVDNELSLGFCVALGRKFPNVEIKVEDSMPGPMKVSSKINQEKEEEKKQIKEDVSFFEKIILNPMNDRFVYTPNNSYPSTYLLTGYSVANNNRRKSFIKFELALPDISLSKIACANLLLTTCSEGTSSGDNAKPQEIGVYQLIQQFNDDTFWNNSPAYKEPGVITTVKHFNTQYKWDITKMVKES